MQLSDFNRPNLIKDHSKFPSECYILDSYILAYSKTYALLWGMDYFVNYNQSRGALSVSPGHSFMDTFRWADETVVCNLYYWQFSTIILLSCFLWSGWYVHIVVEIKSRSHWQIPFYSAKSMAIYRGKMTPFGLPYPMRSKHQLSIRSDIQILIKDIKTFIDVWIFKV